MFSNIFRRKEDEERVRSEGRLPPGQSLTEHFPVLHYGPVPSFNPCHMGLSGNWRSGKPAPLDLGRIPAASPHQAQDGYPLCYSLEQV